MEFWRIWCKKSNLVENHEVPHAQITFSPQIHITPFHNFDRVSWPVCSKIHLFHISVGHIGNLRFPPPNLFISILKPTLKTPPGCEHRWAGCEHCWQGCEHCWWCPVGAPFHFPSFPPWLTSFTKGINRWVPPGKKIQLEISCWKFTTPRIFCDFWLCT